MIQIVEFSIFLLFVNCLLLSGRNFVMFRHISIHCGVFDSLNFWLLFCSVVLDHYTWLIWLVRMVFNCEKKSNLSSDSQKALKGSLSDVKSSLLSAVHTYIVRPLTKLLSTTILTPNWKISYLVHFPFSIYTYHYLLFIYSSEYIIMKEELYFSILTA